MLYGGYMESKKPPRQVDDNQEWVVKLPEDNPKAMELLLSIVHGQFHVVPGYEDPIGVQNLYDIAVLTDKYDMAHILEPWARGWLRSIPPMLCSAWLEGESAREQFYHKRLWISWALGERASFEEITKIMLMNCSNSMFPSSSNLRCSGVLEPPEIYGKFDPKSLFFLDRVFGNLTNYSIADIMEKVRLDTIKALLAPFNAIITRLIVQDTALCQRHKSWGVRTDVCVPLMLGTGIQSLHSKGLWPIPLHSTIWWSIQLLSDKLKSVNIDSQGLDTAGFASQCSYGPTLRAEIEKILNSIPSLLTEGHKRHFESQAKKSGVLVSE
jgi:hypothetical protein